ncbi:MAG: T9SS type A sorting domain-containing protein [Melioribacter sp.]|nr:T9SS type A sorting domain-containing protein [Melioribacter sp.]
MKNLFVFFLFLFIASLNAQWQPEVRLTNDPNNSYTSFGNARCIATNGNIIHVVWYDGVTIGEGTWKIYYKRSTDNGLTWSANVDLSNNVSIAYNPAIAVSGNYIHVVWYDNRDGNFEEYYKRSVDGGITWGPEIRLTNNIYKSLHPSIFVSGLNVHIVWNDNRDGNYEVYYKNSLDGGDTWSADLRLSNTAGKSWTPAVAVSGSVIHVVWHDSTAGNWEIFYKRSTDGGVNWGADTRLTNNSAISEYPTLAVSGSIVHIAWNDYRNGTLSNIYYKRSTDGGISWGADTKLTMKNNNNDSFASLAVNGSNVHLTFNSYRSKNYDIIYNTSSNNGTTWGSDVLLTTNSAVSNVPSIAVSGSNVHVIFRDWREGANSEIYYKRYLPATGKIPKNRVTDVEQEETLPVDFQLMQNYPNPFNPTTTISFSIPQAEYATLKVYDVIGREVAALVNEFKDAGNYNFNFDASKLSSGIYLYRLQAGNFVDVKRMILMK